MGRHGRRVNYSACNGTGRQATGDNGTTRKAPCVVCNGTGKV